jgi:membrane protease YdiL (CAAX protease family)
MLNMISEIKWNAEDIDLVTAVSVTTIGFIIYWFISLSTSVRKKFNSKYGEQRTEILWVLFQKLTGVLFLGIFPAIICLVVLDYSLSDYGINFENFKLSLFYLTALSAIIIPLTIISGKKEDTISTYPQIRVKEWNYKLLIINTLNWALYLFAYEFLFRGILLKSTISTLGFWPAIVLNTSLYSCTHIPKGATETIAAIPFGIILCIITIHTGSIWVAFLAHLILALTNDYAALHYNQEMKIKA